MASLYLRPIPIKRALRWNVATHRRLPALQGGMWAVAVLRRVEENGVRLLDKVVGVAIVGRPTSRYLDSQDDTMATFQVLRVAVVEGDRSKTGHKGANSMLYAACARAARAMGAIDMFTYIHHDEEGIALVAAGWIEDESFKSDRGSHGGEWSRPSRPRKKTVEPEPKRRFCAPWSIMVAGLPPKMSVPARGRRMTADLTKPADEMRDLVASVHDYAKANLAPKTVVDREAEFRHFRMWCESKGLPFLPSTPEVVCMYLAARVEGKVRIEWRGRGGELRSSTKRITVVHAEVLYRAILWVHREAGTSGRTPSRG